MKELGRFNKVITLISLLIGLIGAISGLVSAKIAFDQYQETKAKLKIELVDNAIYFPVKSKNDDYANNINYPPYRAIIKITLINKSSVPITITGFELLDQENNILATSTALDKPAETYILGYLQDKIPIYAMLKDNRNLKPILNIAPHDAKDGFIFFPCYLPDAAKMIERLNFTAKLKVKTSHTDFIEIVTLHNYPGDTFNPE
ncbi:hypothetical protein [Anaerospora hongkongensis]|uniref:hypothetical protein n=1 Tax=Anaerospora hongkongensis TaxID=244830 RepID=UPI00289C4DD9|nr:hypothetical protein [Anaerospora hongkongensis]